MRMRVGWVLTVLVMSAGASSAHFNMLLPHTHSAKKGDAVTFTYQWGHPYEHELFDAPLPQSLTVVAPDGARTDLLSNLEKTNVPAAGGKTVTAYRFRFTPDARGDYVFVLKSAPIWMEEDGEFLHDTVKVVLHVQAQKGWDAAAGESFEVVPLTRPYGLQPGMAFQAQVESRPNGAPSAAPAHGRPVEIERYNPVAPKELPPDEFVTRTARPDRGGVVTGTLTEAGWWSLTAARPGGTRERDGKQRRVLERSTLWVYVDEKPAR
jgi:cobalt/nickel transport protein